MDANNKRLIGLTGGIATGKTTVANYLADRYGLPILDADIYAREAVAVNSPILQIIFDRYGDRIKTLDHRLDRSALGEIIFNDESEKQWLEGQIHPFVRKRFTDELQSTKADTIVLAIPLLFEANLAGLVTEIWVVCCDRDRQIARLQQRNNLTRQQAQARINSQLPLEQKIASADVVLVNEGTLQDLFAEIDAAMEVRRKH